LRRRSFRRDRFDASLATRVALSALALAPSVPFTGTAAAAPAALGASRAGGDFRLRRLEEVAEIEFLDRLCANGLKDGAIIFRIIRPDERQ
jgi:hypothetical protein